MKTQFSQRGASLIETMIAVGLLGMVAYFVTTMIKNGTVGQKTLQSSDDARTMTENMAAVLSDPVACANTFALVSPPINPTTTSNVTVIKDALGKAAYTVGDTYSTKSLKLKSIQIGGTGPDPKSGIQKWTSLGSPPTSGTAFVLVTWTQTGVANGSATGATDLTRFFLVNALSLTPASPGPAGNILTCQAQATGGGGGSGYWTLNPSSGNIYNNNGSGGGSVGIGTSVPMGTFDVFTSSGGHSLTVLPSGYVGIGTSTPTGLLQVLNASGSADIQVKSTGAAARASLSFVASPTSGLAQQWSIGPNQSNGNADFEVYDTGSAGPATTRFMVQNGTGKVGIGTTSPGSALEVVGDIKATSFISTSDARLKMQIRSLSDGLEKILQLRGVVFSWRKDGSAGMGVIAQEVEKIFPEIVVTDKNTGLKAVRYDSLVAPLIEAVKSLYGMCRDLMARTDDNSRRLAVLEASNAAKDAAIRNLERRLQDQERETAALRAERKAP
ncbi:MAG: tail fiber domain-containing protein [Bdellovibrionota bacterium]